MLSESKDFYIVDVFAEHKYSGNQLAVFVDAGYFSTAEMQRLALEMNYSETTFILSSDVREGGYDVRIFTPAAEVPFAGHPTLGTAWVIREYIATEPSNKLILNLPVGPIPVIVNPHSQNLWMRQQAPIFGKQIDHAELSKILGVPDSSLDTRFPVQVVSTGLPFLIVPLDSLEAVTQARINHRYFPGILSQLDTTAILIFAPETKRQENDLHVRVFAEYYGVSEDPATGSANGCLAGYLSRYRYFGEPTVAIRVEQGEEIQRPSLLFLKAWEDEKQIHVQVGGMVKPVACGHLV